MNDNTKQANEEVQTVTDTAAKTDAQRKLESMWDGILNDLSINADSDADEAWQRAVDASKKENPREMLDGQRFNGPGE